MHTDAFQCRVSWKFLKITAFSNAYAAYFVFTLHAGGFRCLKIVEGVGGGKKVYVTPKDLVTQCTADSTSFILEKKKSGLGSI